MHVIFSISVLMLIMLGIISGLKTRKSNAIFATSNSSGCYIRHGDDVNFVEIAEVSPDHNCKVTVF